MARRVTERLVAVFLLGVLLFTPPLLVVFDKTMRVLGIPMLYLYLFVSWALLIGLGVLVIRHSGVGQMDESSQTPDGPI